jgi:hypothetical protein
MTNQEVFDTGKIIETFHYINQFDLENDYIGYLVQFNDIVYQLVATEHNILLNPNEEAILFTDNLDAVYSSIEAAMSEPIDFSFNTVDDINEKKDDDFYADDFVIKYKNKVIANTYGPNDWDQYGKFDDSNTNDSDNIDHNFIDFNSPW